MSIDPRRYERQIQLPEIGSRGQDTLRQAGVLVAGAGGLGSISSLYFAAAGVGRLVVVDDDHVELSNLNRQILHSEHTVGLPKVSSAVGRIRDLNSGVHLVPVKERITRDTIGSLLDGIDVIVDGCDNYNTRAVLNRAAIAHGVPWIYGGVEGFNGMVSVFYPDLSPCFECIFPDSNTAENESLRPAAQGIIGPTAGIIASIQAMEAIKLILGVGISLQGSLLRMTGLDMRIQKIQLEPNPDCRTCGSGCA